MPTCSRDKARASSWPLSEYPARCSRGTHPDGPAQHLTGADRGLGSASALGRSVREPLARQRWEAELSPAFGWISCRDERDALGVHCRPSATAITTEQGGVGWCGLGGPSAPADQPRVGRNPAQEASTYTWSAARGLRTAHWWCRRRERARVVSEMRDGGCKREATVLDLRGEVRHRFLASGGAVGGPDRYHQGPSVRQLAIWQSLRRFQRLLLRPARGRRSAHSMGSQTFPARVNRSRRRVSAE